MTTVHHSSATKLILAFEEHHRGMYTAHFATFFNGKKKTQGVSCGRSGCCHGDDSIRSELKPVTTQCGITGAAKEADREASRVYGSKSKGGVEKPCIVQTPDNNYGLLLPGHTRAAVHNIVQHHLLSLIPS